MVLRSILAFALITSSAFAAPPITSSQIRHPDNQVGMNVNWVTDFDNYQIFRDMMRDSVVWLPSVKNGRDGTLTNAGLESWNTDVKYLSMDGTANAPITFDGRLTVGSPDELSCFARVRVNSLVAGLGVVVSEYKYDTSDRSWSFGVTSGNEIRVVMSGDGTTNAGAFKDYKSVSLLTDGQWHVVGFVFKQNTLKLYLDGVEVEVVKTTDGTVDQIADKGSSFTIGSYDDTTSTYSFLGDIRDVQVYDRALVDHEIETIHEGGAARFPLGRWKLDTGYGTTAFNSAVTKTTSPVTITKTGGTDLTWDARFTSNDTAAANTEIEVQAYVSSITTNRIMFGLADVDTGNGTTVHDFGLYINNNQLRVRENGADAVLNAATLAVGSKLGIKRAANGTVTYLHNDVVVHTSVNTSTLALFFDAILYDSNETLKDLVWLVDGEPFPMSPNSAATLSFDYSREGTIGSGSSWDNESGYAEFDGVDDYIEFPVPATTDSKTVVIEFDYNTNDDGHLLQVVTADKGLAVTLNSTVGGTQPQISVRSDNLTTSSPTHLFHPSGLLDGERCRLVVNLNATGDLSSATVNGISLVSGSYSISRYQAVSQHQIGSRQDGSFPYAGRIYHYSFEGIGDYPMESDSVEITEEAYANLDGVDDYFSTPVASNSLGANRSFVATVTPEDLSATNAGRYRIIQQSNVGATRFGLAFDSGKLVLLGDAGIFLVQSGTLATGQEYHVAATSDGTTHRLYLDGSEVGSSTASISSTAATLIYIGAGADADTARLFEGKIRDVRIFDKVLSLDEINKCKKGNPVSGAVAEWKFDETSGTSAADSSSNGNTATLTGDTGANVWQPAVGKVIDVGRRSKGHDLTLSGDTGTNVWATPGQATLDGVDDYFDAGDDDAFSFGDAVNDKPFTISAWVNMTDATDFRIVAKNSNSPLLEEYAFTVNSSDELQLVLYDADANIYVGRKTEVLTDSADLFRTEEGSWLHVVATYDGRGGANAEDGINLYANGGLVDISTVKAGTYTAMHNTTATLLVASNRTTSSANGSIKDVRMFDRALSFEEIQSVKDGKFLPGAVGHWALDETSGTTAADGSGNDGTMSGATFASESNEDFITFDGVDSYVSVPDHADFSFGNGTTDQPFSVGAWVYPRSFGSDKGAIVSKSTNTSVGNAEWVLLFGNSGEAIFILYDGDTGNSIRSTVDVGVSLNAWHHISATYDGSATDAGITIYVDGVDVAQTKLTSGTYIALHDTGTPIDFGVSLKNAGAFDRWADGGLRDVRVFNKVLSADEVKLAAAGKIVSNEVGRWKLDGDLVDSSTTSNVDYGLRTAETLKDHGYQTPGSGGGVYFWAQAPTDVYEVWIRKKSDFRQPGVASVRVQQGIDASNDAVFTADGTFSFVQSVIDASAGTGSKEVKIESIDNDTVVYMFRQTEKPPANVHPDDISVRFHPIYLDLVRRFGVLRFMDFGKINRSGTLDAIVRDNLMDPDRRNQASIQFGGSIEHFLGLCEIANANPWISFPHTAGDKWIEKNTKKIKAWKESLPGKKVYIEYSNELWNSLFWQSYVNPFNNHRELFAYAMGTAGAANYPSDSFNRQIVYEAGKRSAEFFNRVDLWFTDYIECQCAQASSNDTTAANGQFAEYDAVRNVGRDFEILGIADYLTWRFNPGAAATWPTARKHIVDEGIRDVTGASAGSEPALSSLTAQEQADVDTYLVTNYPASYMLDLMSNVINTKHGVAYSKSMLEFWKTQADARTNTVRLGRYESGQHLTPDINHVAPLPNWCSEYTTARQSSRMAVLIKGLQRVWYEVNGADGGPQCFFTLFQKVTDHTSYGYMLSQFPLDDSNHRWRALQELVRRQPYDKYDKKGK